MTLRAAATGFILLLLSVEVVQDQSLWKVKCDHSSSCYFTGSSVQINCTITSPPSLTNKVERASWLTELLTVDLRSDPQYKDRVSASSVPGKHTLIITDLRESDSARYSFKVETNFTGGIFIRVTDFELLVTGPQVGSGGPISDRPQLSCDTVCSPPGPLSYIWYKNGEEIQAETSKSYVLEEFRDEDNFSCALKGHEDVTSPPFFIQDQDKWKVKCDPSAVCAFKGSAVDLVCQYWYNPLRRDKRNNVLRMSWFTKKQNGEPVELRQDPQYGKRLWWDHSDSSRETLTIEDLRESDSAVYNVRLETNQTVDTSDASVSLTVTDPILQVQVMKLISLEEALLLCLVNCKRIPLHFYIWYKNGEEIITELLPYYESKNLSLADSYSCALEEHKDFPSPFICLFGSLCNRVTYTDRKICAPKGSSLNISCYYNSYENITSKFWFSPELSHRWHNSSLPEDLSEDSLYAGRVQVLEPERGRSTLTIRDLRESDSADYCFKFQTQSFEWKSRLPATTVSVTGALQVQVRRLSTNQSSTFAELRCVSGCSPADPLSYTWFRDRETKISGAETFVYKVWFSLEEEISCAFKGHEEFLSPPVYAPKSLSVVLSSFGEIVEDSLVTLTCSSDANPEANYTWYKKNGDPDFQTLVPEAELLFSSIQSTDSGEYYCEAENHLGKRRSKLFMLDVKYKSTLTINAVHLALIPGILVPVLLLCLRMSFRHNTTVISITEPNEPEETVELQSRPDNTNPPALRGVAAVQTPDTEEQETPE